MDGIRFGTLLDLLYPRTCLACGGGPLPRGRTWLCVRCLARIEPLGPSPCPVCSGALGVAEAVSGCPDCRRLRPRFDGAVAVGAYDGLLSELVTRMKYGRDATLAWPLGELLADTVALWPEAESVDRVVPVPLPLARRFERGFNQAERIAAMVARRLRLPLDRGALVAGATRERQAGLSRTRRLRAKRGTMRVRDLAAVAAPALARLSAGWRERLERRLAPGVRGGTILVVDDVMTTGATLSEAARALKRAGARRVLAAVVARA